MRAFTGIVVCWVCLLAAPAPAAEQARGRHWLRRITWGAGCAASAWDVQTTLSAVRRGAVEGNPLLVNAQGAPRWGRIITIKAGTCAGTFLVETMAARHGARDWHASAANAAIAAAFGSTAIHNIELGRRLANSTKPATADDHRPN